MTGRGAAWDFQRHTGNMQATEETVHPTRVQLKKR
jgi:hypothetical protein